MSEIPQNERRPEPVGPTQQAGVMRTLYERAALTWRLFWDERVGWLPKAIPVAAVAYMISPLDLAPALLLGPLAPLGVMDDIGIMLLALKLFIDSAPPDVVAEHLRELGAAMRSGGDYDVVEGHAEPMDEE